jgi:hypothetical protein
LIAVSGIKFQELRRFLAEFFLRGSFQRLGGWLLGRERDFEAAFVVIPSCQQGDVILPARRENRGDWFEEKISVDVGTEIKAARLWRDERIEEFLRRESAQVGKLAHTQFRADSFYVLLFAHRARLERKAAAEERAAAFSNCLLKQTFG